VLDDGQARLALVVCDLRHISAEVAENAKQIIQKTTGIPPQCVLISATHTHTSSGAKLEEREGQPYYDYGAVLTRRIADGVLRAHNQLEPAQIGWGVVEEPTQVFNRRWFLTPKRGPVYGAHDNIEQVDTNPGYTGLLRPAGPVDPQITFVSVKSTSGKPISLLASYGCTTSAACRRIRSPPIISRSSPIAWASCSAPTGVRIHRSSASWPTEPAAT
jgi:hypothetical protein